MAQLTLNEYINTHPNMLLEAIAEEYQVSLKDVIVHLPQYQLVSSEYFDQIWQAVRTWGEVMFLLHLPDVIVEIECQLPDGKHQHGYFNLKNSDGFSGHINAANCVEIAFVERKFSTMDTAAIIFLNQKGESMFKIFVGYDKDFQLQQDQLVKFKQLPTQLSLS